MNKNQDISNWLIEAIMKENNIPVGSDINIEEYILMSKGKIKKNKKYWKREAKAWRGIARIETDSANEWSFKYYHLNKDYEALDEEYMSLIDKYDEIKRELNVLRQYNIDNYKAKQIVIKSSVPPSNTTSTSTSGYSCNTTFDFTKPKKKSSRWWKRSR
jgi:hypothetical protein